VSASGMLFLRARAGRSVGAFFSLSAIAFRPAS
jgi:hypothetical protein